MKSDNGIDNALSKVRDHTLPVCSPSLTDNVLRRVRASEAAYARNGEKEIRFLNVRTAALTISVAVLLCSSLSLALAVGEVSERSDHISAARALTLNFSPPRDLIDKDIVGEGL